MLWRDQKIPLFEHCGSEGGGRGLCLSVWLAFGVSPKWETLRKSQLEKKYPTTGLVKGLTTTGSFNNERAHDFQYS